MSNKIFSNFVEVIQVHKASRNSDLTEGRGSDVVIGYFKELEHAKLAAKGQCVMGRDGDIASITVPVIYTHDGIFMIGDKVRERYVDPAEIRKNALSKLTEEEKLALGLYDYNALIGK